MKIKLLICALAMFTMSVTNAQELKIGYTNAEYLLGLLPEAKQIEADLRAYETQLQNQLKGKVSRFADQNRRLSGQRERVTTS